MARNEIYCKKEFLNKDFCESDASIFANVVISEHENTWVSQEIQLKVRDCNNVVSLAFDITSEKGQENNLHKIDILINNLMQFKESLVKAREKYVEIEAKIRENNDTKTDGGSSEND